jgi:hypothetical protein
MEQLYFGKTFDEIFDKSFKVFTKGIEEHNFRHFNNSLGIYIYSKEHLKNEMKKRRMLPYDVCEELSEDWQRKNGDKSFDKLSPKADSIIRSLKLVSDKNGNIKLGDKAIAALVEIGAISTSPYRPSDFQGGFS